MLDVITMSSKGQFVIPKEIREEMNLKKMDKFAIVHDRNSILLKRISKEEAKKSMLKLMDIISDKFVKAGITENDIKEELKKTREAK